MGAREIAVALLRLDNSDGDPVWRDAAGSRCEEGAHGPSAPAAAGFDKREAALGTRDGVHQGEPLKGVVVQVRENRYAVTFLSFTDTPIGPVNLATCHYSQEKRIMGKYESLR